MATHWHYRIVRHHDGNLSLCEVYFDGSDITEIVRQPLFSAFTPGGETERDIVKALRNALRDARDKPILDESQATGA